MKVDFKLTKFFFLLLRFVTIKNILFSTINLDNQNCSTWHYCALKTRKIRNFKNRMNSNLCNNYFKLYIVIYDEFFVIARS